MLWGRVLGRKVTVALGEDNQACIQVLVSGQNPTMRHLERTRAVSVKWAREQCNAGRFGIEKVESAHQTADLFAKPFVDKVYLNAARSNVLLIGPASFWCAPKDGGGGGLPLSIFRHLNVRLPPSSMMGSLN
eukprot:12101567-Alexandrium_andersonii.AAC.1